MGPWRLLRLLFRTVLYGFLTWLAFAILWVVIPFPPYEHEGDNGSEYATSVLQSGKWLTRVYPNPERWGFTTGSTGFILDYHLHAKDLTLEIAGSKQRLSLTVPQSDALINVSESKNPELLRTLNVKIRVADSDGANLPWFPKADAYLLFWRIHKNTEEVSLIARWNEQDGLTKLTLQGNSQVALVLEIAIQNRDPKTIVATVPQLPNSGSPSMTYPIRAFLIFFIAPTALFVVDYVGVLVETVFNLVLSIFHVAVDIFLIFAIIVSLWRCLRGPSFGAIIVWTEECLDRRNWFELLHPHRVDAIKEALSKFKGGQTYDNSSWAQWFLQICKQGWHPEKESASRTEADADLEKSMYKPEPGATNDNRPTTPSREKTTSNKKAESNSSSLEVTVDQGAPIVKIPLDHSTQKVENFDKFAL